MNNGSNGHSKDYGSTPDHPQPPPIIFPGIDAEILQHWDDVYLPTGHWAKVVEVDLEAQGGPVVRVRSTLGHFSWWDVHQLLDYRPSVIPDAQAEQPTIVVDTL